MFTQKTQQKFVALALGLSVLGGTFVAVPVWAQEIDAQNVNLGTLRATLQAAKQTKSPAEIAQMLKDFYQANPQAFSMYLSAIVREVPEAAPALMTELKTELSSDQQKQVFTQIVSTLQTVAETNPEVAEIAQQVIAENDEIVVAIQEQVDVVQSAAGQPAEEVVAEEDITEEDAQESTN